MLGLCFSLGIPLAATAETRIVSWNASPAFYEGIELKLDDYARLAEELDPDVLVLVEVGGLLETRLIADALGWDEYYLTTSNWAVARTNTFFALEAAVISKIPIEQVVEYDTSLDGYHPVHRNGVPTAIPITELKLLSDGIPNFGETLAHTDRGTMRVDLANGLSIFPVHLKSNRNRACFALSDALNAFEKYGYQTDPSADEAPSNGFPGATHENIRNAEKRERVMAAVVRVAQEAVDDGRITMIAGDFNTSFEEGKFGIAPEDCILTDFSCEKAPFPAAACTGGDGFDDTMGILEAGLVSDATWTFLSRDLGRTYRDAAFADKAIDHIAVDAAASGRFTTAIKADGLYGSDHFPLITVFD